MRKVIEKLLFQTEGSTKYMILNSPGVILKTARNKGCYNPLPFITLLETWEKNSRIRILQTCLLHIIQLNLTT